LKAVRLSNGIGVCPIFVFLDVERQLLSHRHTRIQHANLCRGVGFTGSFCAADPGDYLELTGLDFDHQHRWNIPPALIFHRSFEFIYPLVGVGAAFDE
jgi:hypothetical protein